MGRLAEAVCKHRKLLRGFKEGDTPTRLASKTGLQENLDEILEAFDDVFDEKDRKAFQWLQMTDGS
jgi:hypothetical protein